MRAAVHPEADLAPGRRPPISVVVPTRDRPERIVVAAELILANEYPDFELIIVDQSSDERSAEALTPLLRRPRVRRLVAEPRGVAAARDLGVAAAAHDLVAMTDDDCRVPRDWLEKLARAFATVPECDVVFGNVVPAPIDPERGFIPSYVRRRSFVARTLPDKADAEGMSACMGIRRGRWRELGGFDERFGAGAPLGAGAEIDYTIRVLAAKGTVYETPEVAVTHDGFRDWKEAKALVRRYWFGAGAVYGKHFRSRPLGTARLLSRMSSRHGLSRSRVAASLGRRSFALQRLTAFGRGFLRGLFLPRWRVAASAVRAELAPASALVLVCPHLGDGGVQRVVSTLANAWAARGRRVSIVTLYRHRVLYALDPRVHVLSIPDWDGAGPWLALVEAVRIFHERVLLALERVWRALWGGTGGPAPWPLRVLAALRDRAARYARRILSQVSGGGWLRRAWKLYLPIALRVRALRLAIDHLGAHNVISFCGSTNIMAVLACEGLPRHLVISERNDPARQRLRFPWNALRPVFYGDAPVVTANTRGALRTMEAYVHSSRLAFVPNPLASGAGAASAAEGAGLEGPRLLIVGRLEPAKAHAVLFDAVARLPAELAAWRLSIVGQGDLEEELRDRAERLGIADRLDWHGQVGDPRPNYEAATIFVLPSLHEGSPNALLEAMSWGLPVIVSDGSPGPLERVTHEVNGLVCPVGDADALARTIARLARSPALRRRLGDEARRGLDGHRLADVLAAWEALLDRSDAAGG